MTKPVSVEDLVSASRHFARLADIYKGTDRGVGYANAAIGFAKAATRVQKRERLKSRTAAPLPGPIDSQRLHPADIQAALKKASSSQAAIARAVGTTETMVYLVVHDRGRSLRVASEISRVTGIPVRRLWPGTYDSAPASRKAA